MEELGEEDRPPQANRRTGEVPGTDTLNKLNIPLQLILKINTKIQQPPPHHNKKEQNTAAQTSQNKPIMNKRPRQDSRTHQFSTNPSNISSALPNCNKRNTKSLLASSHFAYGGHTWLATTDGLLGNLGKNSPPGPTHAQSMEIHAKTSPFGMTQRKKRALNPVPDIHTRVPTEQNTTFSPHHRKKNSPILAFSGFL